MQGDLRQGGKRASSVRVSIGDTREMSTRTARAIAKEHLGQISKGQHPKADHRGIQVGAPEAAADKPDTQVEVTLRQAWQRYLEAHLVRKGRSETTIDGYRGHVEADLCGVARHPPPRVRNGPSAGGKEARRCHKRESGPLRAIYNHARKTNRSPPPDNPADAIDITRHKPLDDYLRRQQQAISRAVFAALGTSLTESRHLKGWLGRGATRDASPMIVHDSHLSTVAAVRHDHQCGCSNDL